MKTGWINDGKRNYYLKPNGVWKNILIGVIGNNEAGAATTAAKVREMGVDAVIVTGGYDPSQYDGIIIPGGGDHILEGLVFLADLFFCIIDNIRWQSQLTGNGKGITLSGNTDQ